MRYPLESECTHSMTMQLLTPPGIPAGEGDWAVALTCIWTGCKSDSACQAEVYRETAASQMPVKSTNLRKPEDTVIQE